MCIDLHTHSNYSDGTDTPAQLVEKAVQAGLQVVGLCDHDTFAGINEAVQAAQNAPIKVVPGVEISACVKNVTVHLLGYGCRPDSLLAQELAKIVESRRSRISQIVERANQFGLRITVAEVYSQAGYDLDAQANANATLGRPHVADALVAKGYVKNRAQAFKLWLDDDCPLYVPHYQLDLAHAIDLVHSAGGVAVLAHPWARGRDRVLRASYLLELSQSVGLDGWEADHQNHDSAQREDLKLLASEAGVFYTGASDYHGSGKTGFDLGVNTTAPDQYEKLSQALELRAKGFRAVEFAR